MRLSALAFPLFATTALLGCGGSSDDTTQGSGAGAGAASGAAGAGGGASAGAAGKVGGGGAAGGGGTSGGGAGGAAAGTGGTSACPPPQPDCSCPGGGLFSPKCNGTLWVCDVSSCPTAMGGAPGTGGNPSTGGHAGVGGNGPGAGGASPGVGGSSAGTGGNGPGAGGQAGFPGCDPAGQPDCGCQSGPFPATCLGTMWKCLPPPSCSTGAGGQGGCPGSGGSSGGGASPTGGFPTAYPDSAVNPPADPGTGAPAESGEVVMAVRNLYLGDTDWNGNVSDTAWQLYGYELDGKVFPSGGTPGHCKPQAGAAAADLTDAPDGLDNSWGKNVIPVLASFQANISQTENDAIAAGSFSLLLALHGLGSQSSYEGLTTEIFSARGSDGAGNPTLSPVAPSDAQWLDGTYVWHPDPAGVADPTAPPGMIQSKNPIPFGYVVSDLYVSGAPSAIVVPIAFGGGTPLEVQIFGGVVRGTLSADRKSLTKGVVGGLVPTELFLAAIKQAAVQVSTSFCTGSTIDGLLDTFRGASDILHDGTQDPAQVCDAISIGFGFEGQTAHLGAVAPASPAVDPCGCP